MKLILKLHYLILTILFLAFFLWIFDKPANTHASSTSFGPNLLVSDDISDFGSSGDGPAVLDLDIAKSVYVAWIDHRNTQTEVFFSKLTSDGASFSANKPLTGINDAKGLPQIEESSGQIYIAWFEHRTISDPLQRGIFFTKSGDGGQNFNEEVFVDSSDGTPFAMVAKNSEIYIAYSKVTKEIWLAKSVDSGASFSKVKISDSSSFNRQRPAMNFIGNNVYAFWLDSRNGGKYEVFYTRSQNAGLSFEANRSVFSHPNSGIHLLGNTFGRLQAEVSSSGQVFLAFDFFLRISSTISDSEVYLLKSQDAGNNFLPTKRLSDDPIESRTQQQNPSLTLLPDGSPAVAWEDRRDNDGKIMLSYSQDQGETFSANIRINNTNGDNATRQTIVSDDQGKIHFVRLDGRLSPVGIWYTKIDLGINFEVPTQLTDQQLAEMYLPVFYIDPGDYFPRPVEIMLDIGTLNFDEGASIGFIRPPLNSADLYEHKDSRKNYIDLPAEIDQNSQHKNDYLKLVATDKYPVTSYTRVVHESNHVIVQYWFFAYYNDWWNKHEGDWEMIEVVLDQNQKPQFAAYSQHVNGTKRDWNDVIKDEVAGSKTHPRVYVGIGSHASYFQFKENGYKQLTLLDTVSLQKLNEQVKLDFLKEKDQVSLDNHGWLAFEGLWGENSKLFNSRGPRGPAVGNEHENEKWFNSFNWGINLKDDLNKWGFTKVSVHSPIDLEFYDSNGHRISRNESEIAGGEYQENQETDQKTIIVPGENSQSGFKIKLIGIGTGTFDLDIQTTDFQTETNYKVNFSNIPVSVTANGQIIINQDYNFELQLDNQNDGIFETSILPTQITQEYFDTTPPTATANILGTKGDNNWYRSDVTVELSASDINGSDVDQILYDLGDGLTEYIEPIVFTNEGSNQLQFLATDNAGNASQIEFLEIKIDKTAPAISIISPENKDYLHSDTIQINLSTNDNISGIQTINTLLDGNNLNTNNIDLFFENLGQHTFLVEAQDYAGNTASASVNFRVIASFESILSDVDRAYLLGIIDNNGIKNSLIKKINAAIKNKEQENLEAAKSQLNAFINEVLAQKAKHVTNNGATILIDSARYLLSII